MEWTKASHRHLRQRFNENVFSGDVVSADHLKNQYGLVVGEDGVRRVRKIVALDDENREINASVRATETQIDAVIRSIAPPTMKRDDFLALAKREDIDKAITEKDGEAQRVRRVKEIKAAAEPQVFPVPTDTQKFRELLASHIDEIAETALVAVRAHIAAHEAGGHPTPTRHEGWLEAGTAFMRGDDCPFCGQPLSDRALVDAYKDFFSAAYKALAENVRKARETFARYRSGEFRNSVENQVEQNILHFGYWREAGKLDPPDLHDAGAVIARMEDAAARLDAVFKEKQANLTQVLIGQKSQEALTAWDKARTDIVEINALLSGYLGRIRAVKNSIDPSHESRLENELKTLQAAKRRHEPDISAMAEKLTAHAARKEAIGNEKAKLRDELNEHGRSITATLGTTINIYLGRLNAGFRIDYREPDYRGKEPAASYQILINDVPVSPRSTAEALDQPSFRNTLSGGDKFTLALALFRKDHRRSWTKGHDCRARRSVHQPRQFSPPIHRHRNQKALRPGCADDRPFARQELPATALGEDRSRHHQGDRPSDRRSGYDDVRTLRHRSGHAAAARHGAYGNRGIRRG